MKERIVAFGEDKGLVGVLKSGAGETGLLFLNAGIVHRIGPHRMNVKLARAFDAPSLRFDLSGLGDSRPSKAGVAHDDQVLADIRAAVDILSEAGATRIVMLGLCSGADDAYRAARVDERIRGLVLLDPYAYASSQARLGRLLEKAVDPARWVRAASRLVGGGASEKADVVDDAGADVSEDLGSNDRVFPPREEFGRDLEALAQSGVDILILYSSFVAELLTKPAHFFQTFDGFDFADRITVDVNREADHTYTLLESQAALVLKIDEWLAARGFKAS